MDDVVFPSYVHEKDQRTGHGGTHLYFLHGEAEAGCHKTLKIRKFKKKRGGETRDHTETEKS